jgi:hypothetical protein
MADQTENEPRLPGVELGVTGLKRTSGYVDEEFLPQLRGRKAVQVYREMSDNDPTIGALVFSFDRLLRQVEWPVEPGDSSDEQRQAAEFLEQCRDDMSHTFDEFISEALTSIVYGWSWHEIVWKRRIGPWEKDSSKRSKYTDGRIGIRKMPIRSQETLLRWEFDETGGVKGMWQMAPPDYKTVFIPIERSLLFRPVAIKNNPEGRSMLRNAYRPWYMKKRLEEFEVLGVERDLVGMPKAGVPVEYLNAKPGSREEQVVKSIKKLVKGLRRDEHEGFLFPNDVDRDTKMPLFSLDLLGGGGSRQFNTAEIINRYDERMLMSVLADFILVGHQGTGSYSMHTDKTGLFRSSVNTIAQAIADVLNMHMVPRLFAINGWKVETLPKFKPTNVDPPDLAQLASFIGQLSSAGMQFFPDPDLEKFARRAAQLPELDERELKALEAQSRQQQVMRVAQGRLDLLQLGQQAASQAMALDAQGGTATGQALGTEPPVQQPAPQPDPQQPPPQQGPPQDPQQPQPIGKAVQIIVTPPTTDEALDVAERAPKVGRSVQLVRRVKEKQVQDKKKDGS